MRILCDACGAKYQVDDSKVGKRSFKFPCKKCGHTVVVRQTTDSGKVEEEEVLESDAAFEATEQIDYESHMAKQAEEEGAVWYVALGQERVGPVTAADVQAYIDQGQVVPSSFVWSEGMDDWARLDLVPALARLLPDTLATDKPEPLVGEVVTGAQAPTPFSQPSGDFQSEVEAAKPAESASPSDGEDLFVSEHREATFDEPSDSPVISTAQLTGQRHENSVLFSLDSLDKEESGQPGVMKPSASGNTEASGLIDLAMLGSDTNNLDKIFQAGAAGGSPVGAPIKPMASLVTQPSSNRLGLIIGAVVLTAGLSAAGVYFVMQSMAPNKNGMQSGAAVSPGSVPSAANPAQPSTQAKADAIPRKASQAKPKRATAPVDAVEAKTAESVKPTAQTSKKTVGATAKKKSASTRKTSSKPQAKSTRSRSKKNAQSMKRKRMAAAAKPKPKPKPKPKAVKPKPSSDAAALLASLDGGGSKRSRPDTVAPSRRRAPAVDPTLPETLDRSQVLGAVRRNMAKIRDCRRLEPDIAGQVVVRFMINGNGRVGSAKAQGQYANTPIGKCVGQKVRAIRFPRFSGNPIPIKFPFRL